MPRGARAARWPGCGTSAGPRSVCTISAKPTIAAVNGVAAGAGLNLALGCDLVIASERARFSEIFSKRGLVVDFGGSWVLPRLIGMHRAKELVLLADVIDATEAERIGLVNRVVAHGDLGATVGELANRLANMAPLALAASKRLLNQSFAVSMAEAIEGENTAQALMASTRDTRRGDPRVLRAPRAALHRLLNREPGRGYCVGLGAAGLFARATRRRPDRARAPGAARPRATPRPAEQRGQVSSIEPPGQRLRLDRRGVVGTLRQLHT